ncbi:hypothetical protein [Kiritimatiella glycovorans]|uniref:DUF998 domain-containing protein n=1 Tax=Kiritimatiella glycovorans TaxID=1307763 RepID=A0A0G3EHI7_9BACT|nr:hypothetical protein [Kiritimatiella glycovorans]AKJ64867.1 hypothetical protein L21SP4_01624 [Kiritimatiella glycovorans]
MNHLHRIGFGALIMYTVALFAVEKFTSFETVYHFMTDIKGPVPYYAINTSLSTFFLGAASLLFLFQWSATPRSGRRDRRALFALGQCYLFAFLALDDRLMAHEHFAWITGIHEIFWFGSAALAEAALVLLLADVAKWPRRAVHCFVGAVGAFGIMMLTDLFVPRMLLWRICFEDLAKLWAAALLFMFAWELTLERITLRRELKGEPDESS